MAAPRVQEVSGRSQASNRLTFPNQRDKCPDVSQPTPVKRLEPYVRQRYHSLITVRSVIASTNHHIRQEMRHGKRKLSVWSIVGLDNHSVYESSSRPDSIVALR